MPDRVVTIDAVHRPAGSTVDRLIGDIGRAVFLHLAFRVGGFDVDDRLPIDASGNVLNPVGRVGVPVNGMSTGIGTAHEHLEDGYRFGVAFVVCVLATHPNTVGSGARGQMPPLAG